MVTKKKDDVNLKGILNSLEETTEESKEKTNVNTDQNTINNTNSSITDNTVNEVKNNTKTNQKFVLRKKSNDKKDKKAFNVYMEDNLVKNLDKICKKTGHTRNELINIMCEYCVENLEIVED